MASNVRTRVLPNFEFVAVEVDACFKNKISSYISYSINLCMVTMNKGINLITNLQISISTTDEYMIFLQQP